MQIAEIIESKIKEALPVIHLQLVNDSHKHAGPATESHFNLLIVSDAFVSLNKVKRHQLVYKILKDELAGPIHALSLHLYAQEEWSSHSNQIPDTPNCAN